MQTNDEAVFLFFLFKWEIIMNKKNDKHNSLLFQYKSLLMGIRNDQVQLAEKAVEAATHEHICFEIRKQRSIASGLETY